MSTAPQVDRLSKTCFNCGASGAARFCAYCGQELGVPNRTIRGLFLEILDEFFKYDGKIRRTFLGLMLHPGLLTFEWIMGRRVRFLGPFKCWFAASFIYFFAISIGPDAPAALQPKSYVESVILNPQNTQVSEDFKARVAKAAAWHRQNQSLLNLLDFPLLGLLFMLLFSRPQLNFVDHFVFALHTSAAIMIYAAPLHLVWWLGAFIVELIASFAYVAVGAKRLYADTWPNTLWRCLVYLIIYGMYKAIQLELVVMLFSTFNWG